METITINIDQFRSMIEDKFFKVDVMAGSASAKVYLDTYTKNFCGENDGSYVVETDFKSLDNAINFLTENNIGTFNVTLAIKNHNRNINF